MGLVTAGLVVTISGGRLFGKYTVPVALLVGFGGFGIIAGVFLRRARRERETDD